MMERTLAIALTLSLLSGAATPAAAAVKNPDTYTYLDISDADSMDPAWSYDTASHEAILEIYDTLFQFEGSSTEKMIPLLAEKVPTKANGLITADNLTYTIPIRKGVKFFDGSPLTPEDVKYSIVRFMLLDRNAGPSALLLEPILGYPSTRDEKGNLNPNAFKDAEKAVQVQGNNVVIKLPKPFAPLLTIFCSHSPILSKAWAAKNGAWDGSEATWVKFNNPTNKENSPFHAKAMGTGPFMLDRWDRKTHELILSRHENYWRGPAKLKQVIIKGINEFSTRKLMLQAADADNIYADWPDYSKLQGMDGVRITEDLATIEINPVAFFTFKINTLGNPNLGSGKLDGNGIPADFFNDVNVRKGFAYAFDYQGLIKDVYRGKGSQANGCIPKTLPGHSTTGQTHSFDLKKAEEHFKKAWGGQVWEKGFQFTLLYNSGNVARQNVCAIMKRAVESLNPKFKIDVRPVEWPTFLDAYRASKLPIFVMGWQADYPDPHNFAHPLMHSMGNYPIVQHYANPEADKLIDLAKSETDIAKRKALYSKLQTIEFADVPHLVFINTVRYRPERDWVRGYVFNPVFPQSPWGSYYYPMYKSETAAAPMKKMAPKTAPKGAMPVEKAR
ncbi:MAG: ABC transporter substrate-binding protein [Elusimicrobia bacterium]|nr:ABC transporter substrate-binding protein [Elusimicrobiota bacterium]